jgi:hypothetical protein
MLPAGDLPTVMPESLHLSESLLQTQLLHDRLRSQGLLPGPRDVRGSGSGHVCGSGLCSGSRHVCGTGASLCTGSYHVCGPRACHMCGSGSCHLLCTGPSQVLRPGSGPGQVLRLPGSGQVLRHRLQHWLPEDLLR